MLLLDTDVLIDALRGLPASRAWLESESADNFVIPGIVAMELLVGCRNQVEQARVQKFLAAYPLLWPDATDFARAYGLLSAHRLSNGVGIPDCIIAALAIGHHAPLCTFNRKHFQAFAGLDLREPYPRV